MGYEKSLGICILVIEHHQNSVCVLAVFNVYEPTTGIKHQTRPNYYTDRYKKTQNSKTNFQ